MSERARSYRDLIVWQRSMDLVDSIYKLTQSWPRDQQFGLTSQIRRAAVSIPSNIAEGQGRMGANEFLHHASIAHGSLCELQTQLMLGQRLGLVNSMQVEPLMETAEEIGKMLRALIRNTRDRQANKN